MDLSLSSSMEDEQRLARMECSQPPAARDLESGYLERSQQLPNSSFAEALLFAQSRAREAEEVLYSYDVRVEEAVLRALTLLDASRHKEMLCQQRLELLKQAVLEEEERELQRQQEQNDAEEAAMSPHLDNALERTVLRGISMTESDFAADTGGVADEGRGANSDAATEDAHAQQPAGLLQGAYQKLVSVAMHATSTAPPSEAMIPSPLDASAPEHTLSMQLAQAYADLRDAQESTERHTVLLEELEMLVEPVLQYRHSGVYDADRYAAYDGVVRGGGKGSGTDGAALVDGDGMEAAFQTPEGSSVVFVNTADALREEDAAGCFALLTAKVKAQEESRRLRSVLTRIQVALDSFECWREDAGQQGEEQAGGGASGGQARPAPGGKPGGKPVETKVALLLSLLQSQQDEIVLLRKQLESSKGAVALPGAKWGLDASAHNDAAGAPVFLDHGRGASLFLQKKRLHVDGVTDDQSEESTPRYHAGALDLEAAAHKEPEENRHHVVYGRAKLNEQVCGGYARGLIECSAAQAHMLIDACEEMLLRSMAVALEMLDQALCCLFAMPVVYHDQHRKLQTCADAHCLPPLASYSRCNHPSLNHTDVEWWWGGSDSLYQVYC